MFPHIHVEQTGEIIEAGGYVIVPTRVVGHGRTSGLDVDDAYSRLLEIRDGRIVLVREYHSDAEALGAARARE